ncbi:MAG: hypothetical protein MI724_09750 [Spirochaetales bacterium]|nr:hypothetical protein [Spirochaetales bacterium]
MFENILGLEHVTRDLDHDIRSGRLPQAILIAGPKYGGKSSVAFEVARGLTCRESGRWNCTCRACRLQRTLHHHDTVLAGDRYFDLEIDAALDAFQRERRSGTAFLLVRSVRKLVRRFDPFLWPEARLAKARPIVDSLEEALARIEPSETSEAPWEHLGGKALGALAGEILRDTDRLRRQLPHDPVPVDVVRAIGSWAHLSAAAGKKVLILEEAHTLQEGSRNAMLKLLEQPPQDVYFILTSSRRQAVIPTLLSRLRVYTLPERSVSTQEDVQRRIFRLKEPEHSRLQDFFRRRGETERSWRELAQRTLRVVHGDGTVSSVEAALRSQMAAVQPRAGAEYYLDALSEELRGELPSLDEAGRRRCTAWSRLIQTHHERIVVRNMNPHSVLASLVLSMKRAAEAAGGGGGSR